MSILKKKVLHENIPYERATYVFAKWFKGSMFDASYYMAMLFDGEKEDIMDDLVTMRKTLFESGELSQERR